MDKYLAGEKVYGDDYDFEEIKRWYEDEEKGYYNMYHVDSTEKEEYFENCINSFYGFSKLSKDRYQNVLGLGSADGSEFLPIINRIDNLTIVEIAEGFYSDFIGNVPAVYIKPDVMGKLPFEDGYFDLIMASSVLHHIPNVTYIWEELVRCLKPGGVLIVTEPVIYMGGMEGLRKGLTLRERGIPAVFFENNVKNFNVITKEYINHAISRKIIGPLFKSCIANNLNLLKIDKWMCKHLSFKPTYYTNNMIRKIFQASSIYLVIEKNKSNCKID